MRATNDRLSEKYIVVVARELAKALKGLHEAGIMHRDVKGMFSLVPLFAFSLQQILRLTSLLQLPMSSFTKKVGFSCAISVWPLYLILERTSERLSLALCIGCLPSCGLKTQNTQMK